MRKYLTIFILLLLSGCNKWLSVTPSDTLSEDQTYSSVEGFRNALNNIYIEMTNNNLYGRDLTVRYVEIIAGRYYVNSENSSTYQLYLHNYNDGNVVGLTDAIWKKGYNLIGNINILIKNCEKRKDVISGLNYNIIKGEALALRAFIHFDLFRLFGPRYDATASAEIPYNFEFKFSSPQVVTCEKFMGYVMQDINEAKELLSKDPIILNPPKYTNEIYDYLRNRTTRMNYYAVTLLRSRAALYMDNKQLALDDAKEIIATQNTHYPFTTKSAVENVDNPDRIFSSELIFAIEYDKRGDIFKEMFDPENVSNKSVLGPTYNDWRGVLFGTSPTLTSTSGSASGSDLRAKSITTYREIDYTEYYISYKYKDIAADSTILNRLMPLMRVSEAFYIAAECETDETQAYAYLNTIRNIRGINGTLTENKDIFIMREYIREFLGEGQLFYFYKRKNIEKISNGNNELKLDMSFGYKIPIPLSEHP